jgi:hypothetical protein
MKTFSLTLKTAIIVLLSIGSADAQPPQTKLNQVELMKKFIGKWKGEAGKDTIVIGENREFGTGIEATGQMMAGGKIFNSARQLYGYDKTEDKFIIAELLKSSPVIELLAAWFTSEKSGEMVLYKDISDPENAEFKWKFEFRSPDTIVQTALVNNKVFKEVIMSRVR